MTAALGASRRAPWPRPQICGARQGSWGARPMRAPPPCNPRLYRFARQAPFRSACGLRYLGGHLSPGATRASRQGDRRRPNRWRRASSSSRRTARRHPPARRNGSPRPRQVRDVENGRKFRGRRVRAATPGASGCASCCSNRRRSNMPSPIATDRISSRLRSSSRCRAAVTELLATRGARDVSQRSLHG